MLFMVFCFAGMCLFVLISSVGEVIGTIVTNKSIIVKIIGIISLIGISIAIYKIFIVS